MNARELLDEDKWGLETHLDTAYGEDICQTILDAIRLLAAAEANDGTTPETDALAKLCSTQFQIAEIARSFERERNGLAARMGELAAIKADYKACRAHAERAEAALAECRTKLEVDPRTKYDGISCRDETIRLLEAALAESERKCERLKFHADGMAYGKGTVAINAMVAYRAEFKE